jgi:hypothetical protein
MLPSDPSGNFGGSTYTSTDSSRLVDSYEAIFGPAGRDIKQDPQRHKRHQRWHLPDNLKGRNEYLTDRIDGLITDATSSPFTRNILPYVYMESPDQKIKWNVYSFDEGMASRVPYESAARVLTQSKTSHAGYAVRQGLAIVMEHNFLASAAGMANFQNQLKQLVGSIQLTNDLDVHIALLQAQSYQKTINEKYYSENDSLYDAAKLYVDMFGVMQKIPNALDILIEDAKNHLKTWGSQPPTFLLCPSDLTAQLQMSPERTNYITNGPDGLKRLAQGPDLPSYRGLAIIHSQKFSLEPGRKPRNVLKRRVRIAEYYWVPLADVTTYQIYNQKRDMMTTFDKTHALKASAPYDIFAGGQTPLELDVEIFGPVADQYEVLEPLLREGYCLLLRPNIEHEMLTVIAGRGGTQELGATFWGQTELACYDDAQHGIWGMSYKYHERAIVTNERNLIRMHDVAFDGYGGGMDTDIVKLADLQEYTTQTYDNTPNFRGKSVIAFHFPRYLPSRALTNPYVGMIMDVFVCDGPERDSTTLTPSQLTFRRHMFDATIKSFDLEFPNEYFKLSENLAAEITRLTPLAASNATIAAQLRVLVALRDNFLEQTIKMLRVMRATHDAYIKQRPYEDPLEVHRRMLQQVYKITFTSKAMSVASADRIITHLVEASTEKTTKCDEFKDGFYEALLLIMLNETLKITANLPSVTHLTAMKNGIPDHGTIATLNLRMYIMLLAHGHVPPLIATTDADWELWVTTFEGKAAAKIGHSAWPTSPDMTFINRLTSNLHKQHKYWHDKRYIIHCMQKPAFEVPNPVVLRSFLGAIPGAQTASVDADGSQMIDNQKHHDFATHLLKYFDDNTDFATEDAAMRAALVKIFECYRANADYMWNSVNSTPASSYMQNSTTELPTLAYHGNLTLDKHRNGREDIRCVGHLGNSFPGCASIRQGKGMLNLYERPPTAIHVI